MRASILIATIFLLSNSVFAAHGVHTTLKCVVEPVEVVLSTPDEDAGVTVDQPLIAIAVSYDPERSIKFPHGFVEVKKEDGATVIISPDHFDSLTLMKVWLGSEDCKRKSFSF